MARLFIIIVRWFALKMKGGLVINLSSVQTTLRKTLMISVFTVLLFLTFAVGSPVLSLSTNAAQTASGNTSDAGVISEYFVNNNKIVQSPDGSSYGGSVIYSVFPETEYCIRARLYPSSVRYTQYIHFFRSYPSLGSSAFSDPVFFARDPSTSGNYIISNFTTPSYATYVVVSFRFEGAYSDIRSFLEGATIGSTLGLYSPLSNSSTAELSFGFTNPRELKLFLSGSGGVGNYRFTVDIYYTDNNSENLLSQVPAGSYTRIVPAFDNGDYLIITISDSRTSISTKIIPVIPDVNINTLSSPEVDIDYIPETSISVDNGVADIIADSWSVIPSEITALLIPVVLFSLIGWWLHK